MRALCNNEMNSRDMNPRDMSPRDMNPRDMSPRDMNINLQQRDSMMLEVMKYQFATLDSALFLNTHPNDPVALIRHHEYSTRLMQLKDEFGRKFGPLDSYTPDISGTWRYIDSPWPWE